MDAWWLPGDCQVVLLWLPCGCLRVAWWFSCGCLAVALWLPCGCLVVLWWLPGGSVAVLLWFLWLLGSCLVVAWMGGGGGGMPQNAAGLAFAMYYLMGEQQLGETFGRLALGKELSLQCCGMQKSSQQPAASSLWQLSCICL